MSERELIEAYVHGGITRRVFIRGLVAAGVSMGAALAYAETIAPNALAFDKNESSYGDRNSGPYFGDRNDGINDGDRSEGTYEG